MVQWLDDRKHRIAAGSYASEASITKSLLRILGAESRLDKLADVQAIRRYETRRREEGTSAQTVNNEVLVLAGILRDAKLWRRIAADYKRLKVHKSDLPDAPTREEAYRLLHVAQTADENAVAPYAAILAYSTGIGRVRSSGSRLVPSTLMDQRRSCR